MFYYKNVCLFAICSIFYKPFYIRITRKETIFFMHLFDSNHVWNSFRESSWFETSLYTETYCNSIKIELMERPHWTLTCFRSTCCCNTTAHTLTHTLRNTITPTRIKLAEFLTSKTRGNYESFAEMDWCTHLQST